MTAIGHSNFVLANAGGNGTAIGKAETASVSSLLADAAKAICSRKTWAYLAALIQAQEHLAKHRLAGTRRFTDEDIARLLRSDDGLNYLSAIMADAQPAWWKRFKKHVAVTDATRVLERQKRDLQEAIHEADALTAAIARADALLVQDAEFHRPHADALGAMARVPHRPVAASTKGRAR